MSKYGIDTKVWKRLEKYCKDYLDYPGQIGSIIQQAIAEYLDKEDHLK